MSNLNPQQFLYHGTTAKIEGQVLPAKVHGGQSFWGDTGSSRGEAANEHAWAHPDEELTWMFAHQRVIHSSIENDWNPRARVYAVHPNKEQTPGNDPSIEGEVKAPKFDIAHPIDTMPGRQGTFPEINWNHHIEHLAAEDEDANHPKNLSVQFGHRYGRWGDHPRGDMMMEAQKEDLERYMDRSKALGTDLRINPNKDQPMLPGMSSDDRKYMRPRGVVYRDG